MGVAKVNYNNETLIDLTADTVIADTLLAGETAHDAEGNPVVGLYTPPAVQLAKTVEITENGSHTIQPDEGYAGVNLVTANVNVPATEFTKYATGSPTVSGFQEPITITSEALDFKPRLLLLRFDYMYSSTNIRAGAAAILFDAAGQISFTISSNGTNTNYAALGGNINLFSGEALDNGFSLSIHQTFWRWASNEYIHEFYAYA